MDYRGLSMSTNDWNYPARFQKLHTELDKTNAELKCQKELVKAVQSLFLESKSQIAELKSRVLELEIKSVEQVFTQEIEKRSCKTFGTIWKKIIGDSK